MLTLPTAAVTLAVAVTVRQVRDYLSGSMARILPQLHIVRKDGFNPGLCLPDVQDAQCRCTGHHIHVIYLSCSEIQHNLSKTRLTML